MTRLVRLLAPVVGCVALPTCTPRELPPLGEALVVVDTDLPVPRVASRVRIDTYAEDGTWLESRDIGRPDLRDWPVSFSVQAADDTRDRLVLVRLRVHGGRVRDLREGDPRLVRDGIDVTPPTIPVTELAVDRLVPLRLRPGIRGRVVVVARAACAGVAAFVDGARWESCMDDGTRGAIGEAPLEPSLARPETGSLAGTAARSACPSPVDPAARRDAVCIEGGAFVLGAQEHAIEANAELPATPPRIVRVGGFAMDRHEVTVGRYREALARGFVAPEAPTANEGDLRAVDETDIAATCTFSAAARGREEHALTCVSWATARAFCRFEGGDLPSEAQWELAAGTSGREVTSEFPWGDEPPGCEHAVYGRLTLAGLAGPCEAQMGSGPVAVTRNGVPVAPRDTTPSGVHGLAGGVGEWVRDEPAPYTAACWSRALPRDPVCEEGTVPGFSARGSSWAGTRATLRVTNRYVTPRASGLVGFRCVYPRPDAEGP